MCRFFYLTRLKTISQIILNRLNEHIYSVLAFLIATTIIYNEWLVYSLYASKWPTLYCGNEDYCTRVLLVADPQILGEEHENLLTRWDSDRFLFNTYGRAFQHVRPDNVVFLGDLMDEGSLADQQCFERYFNRFCKIFFLKNSRPVASQNVIFVAGDNDIGGEDEIVSQEKVDRFNAYFGSPEIVEKQNIQFITVNSLIESMPKNMNTSNSTKTIKIVFTHVPLTTKWTQYTDKVLQEFNNEFIFSGHDHTSYNIVSNTKTKKRIFVQRLGLNNLSSMSRAQWRFGQQSPNVVSEIVVPTCSYRMGSENVGYGVLTIDTFRHSVTYTILWSPSRFYSLIMYLCVLVLCFFLYLLHLFTRNG